VNISDGNAGASFFMATGLHGLHVFLGTLFLLVSVERQLLYHYSSIHFAGFEAAS
jgi:heme/copper-type cytochrome/quinol oxidase subunit 3